MALFEIDDAGWIAQNRGRDPWELLREAVQNALDTGEDVKVAIDSRQRKIIIKNKGEGFNNLSDAWTIFGGDKGSDPTKRGRYGRGLKELVAGAENVKVFSTGGSVEFDVSNRERIDLGRTISEGTKIIAHNSEWSKEQMDNMKEYIFSLWAPENQKILVDLKGGRMQENEREMPDHTCRMRLKTVKVEDGVMHKTRRTTDVHIRKVKEGDGRLYEMGIPVNMGEEFPFHADVQQKIPMAEQRNEADSAFLERFRVEMLNECYTMLSKKELRAGWVQEALQDFHCDVEVKQHYVEEVVKEAGKKEVVVASDNQHYNDKARNHGFQVVDTAKMNRGNQKAVRQVCRTADEVAEDLYERTQTPVEPTPEQEAFIEEAEQLAREVGYTGLTFETWEIDPTLDGQNTRADHSGDGTIRLNVNELDWETMDASAVGIIGHEIAHERGTGHDRDWYQEMQRILSEWAVSGVVADE